VLSRARLPAVPPPHCCTLTLLAAMRAVLAAVVPYCLSS
jgi:hypothetical protein